MASIFHEADVPDDLGSGNQGFDVYCSVTNAAGAAVPCSTNAFTQMAADDTIEVLSSSAADVGQVVTVWGIGADGVRRTIAESFTLNGVSAVAGSLNFSLFRHAYIDAETAGTITIQRATGAVLITTITIGNLATEIAHWFAHSVTKQEEGFITYWNAILRPTVAGTFDANVVTTLRVYPDLLDARDMTDGFIRRDEAYTDTSLGVIGKEREFAIPLRVTPGSYIAVVAVGATADFDVNIAGYVRG